MPEIIKSKKGSATVEAAIMLPIFISIILGFTFFLNTAKEGIILQQAAREGAFNYAMYGNVYHAVGKALGELEQNNIDTEDVLIDPVTSGNKVGVRVQREKKVFTGAFESLLMTKKIVLQKLY